MSILDPLGSTHMTKVQKSDQSMSHLFDFSFEAHLAIPQPENV